MIGLRASAASDDFPEPMAGGPRLTFGMIVLNGEPFVRYALDALYPHAHEIIVVEGAAPAAAAVATPRGHSTDATLATLRAYKRERARPTSRQTSRGRRISRPQQNAPRRRSRTSPPLRATRYGLSTTRRPRLRCGR